MEKIKLEVIFHSPQSTDTRFCTIDEEVHELVEELGFKVKKSKINKAALSGKYTIKGNKEELIEALNDIDEDGPYSGLYWEFRFEVDGEDI